MTSTSRRLTGRLAPLLIGATIGGSVAATLALVYHTSFKWDHPWPRGYMSRITVADPYGGEPTVISDEADLELVDVWLRASLQERYTRSLPMSRPLAGREIAIDLADGRQVLLHTSTGRVDVERVPGHFVQMPMSLELDDREYFVGLFPVVLLTAGERAPSDFEAIGHRAPNDG